MKRPDPASYGLTDEEATFSTSNEIILAIKKVRERCACSLKEAKDRVEDYLAAAKR